MQAQKGRRGGGGRQARTEENRPARSTNVSDRDQKRPSLPVARSRSADRPLHLQLNQSGPLNGVLHRKGLGDRFNEARHNHAHRLLFGEATRHEVEKLLVGDLRHRGLVADLGVFLTHLHVWQGLRHGVFVEDERVAFDMALASLGTLVDSNEPAVGGDTTVFRDRLRDNLRPGVGSCVHHLGTSVLVLTLARIRNGQHLTRRALANQVNGGVLHSELRADVAVDPLHVAVGLDLRPFGDEVVNVGRPVLNSGVGDACMRLYHDLDYSRVQRVRRVDGRRAALDVVNL